jgi:cytochrome P450
MSSLDSLPRARAVPVLGSIPFYARDPLGFIERAATLGPIVTIRLGPLTARLLSDPADIERVMVSSSKSFVKDAFARDLKVVIGDGLLISDGDFWRRQRRLVQPAFHRERLAAYAAEMSSCAERMVAGLRDGEVRDVHADMMGLTLDIVARTLFGAEVSGHAADVREALEVVMAHYASAVSVILPIVDRLPLERNRRFRDAVRTLDAIVYGIIERRRAAPDEDRGDLLAMLLAARDEDGSRMTDQQVRDEAMTLFLAGHETTANALSWALLLLSRNPEVDARLGDEVASALGGRTPTLSDLPRLAYVEHVVTEALRLYPPAWALGREVHEPVELRGVHFPVGEQIWLSPWVMHHDARYFDDPGAFDPGRWADGLARRLPRFAYFPFGGGPRLCVGNAFAMMEATLVLATLVQRFRFEVEPRARVVPLPSITLRPKNGIRATLRARVTRPAVSRAPGARPSSAPPA